MPESVKTIFSHTIKESRNSPNILIILKEVVFELSHKKLQNFKNDIDIQTRVNKLFTIYVDCLKKENFESSKAVTSIIEGLIKATSYEKERQLYKDIYEKERMERSIHQQIFEMKELIVNSYKTIENAIEEFAGSEREAILSGLQDAKLNNIEMLGILKDAAEEAFLTAIEDGRDIEDIVREVSKNFTYRAINEGRLSRQRFLEIASSIIEVASNIADTDISCAKEVLNSAVEGTKEGILRAVEKFKNDIKYAPEEAEELFGESLEKSKKELGKMEEYFVVMLKECQLRASGISAEILGDIIEEHDSSFARFKRIGNETVEILGERIEQLKEEAFIWEKEFTKKASKQFQAFKKETGIKVEAFKNIDTTKAKQVTEEAKKLGARSLEIAISMIEEAIKSGKEIMKKDDKNKKN